MKNKAFPRKSKENQKALGGGRSSDIAIIGMSGRFAGSPDLSAFWSHLQAGESCIEPIRRNGWETSTHLDSESANPSLTEWGGMLEYIDRFDPLFFNISPLEAARMDPQQRLFLEEAYKAFEDAGYSAEQLSEKKVGVFVGARSSDYKEQALRRDSTLRLSEEIDAHLFLGNDMAVLAARISYFLNCKGPSLTVDTASSSSLVAIHLACESIRTGESEMALAGGVFVMSSPEYSVMAAKTQMLSPDGKCKTFNKSADGIVIGEGVGTLVLKPLSAAIEDGDHIYGVILGSAINQDGKTLGMTAPSMLSQKALLVSLYKKAAVHPETVSYIEAHGTGSKLGDTTEVQALTEAFGMFTDKKQFCAIGSHKPNFGHTITAAGIAGVFKVLLAMKYEQIPPSINIEEINPQIDFQNSPFFLNKELKEWKRCDGSKRRAGVSSFGLSGTNCHLILEEPPHQEPTAHKQAGLSFFFPFSAKTKASLVQKVADMINWLEKEGERYSVEDIAYTLVQGRCHFPVRTAVVAGNIHDLRQALRTIHSLDESEYDEIKEEGKSSEQTESLLHPYGHELLQEVIYNTSFTQEEYKQRLAALADLYVKGYSLDWGQLFQRERYQRVPLPTYPFLGESYWIETTPVVTRQASVGSEVEHTFGQGPVGKRTIPTVPLISLRTQVPTDRLREALSHMVSDLLKIRVEEIDTETPLTEYGFDSITFTKLANLLNQAYQFDLTPAHFFEYSTLGHLAQYLYATYASDLVPSSAAVSPMGARGTGASLGCEGTRDDGASSAPTASSLPDATATPIAIIGMSGCFPLAPDVQHLWNNLLAGRNCISEIPDSRWDWRTYFGNPATEANKTNVKWAGIVEDVEQFDPLFFGISPREAEQMDPQQRLLMMYVWKAIEDAGYAASSLSGSNTALFVGTTSSGYSERVSRANMEIEGYSSTGQTPSIGPNRMSYFLDLHGPSEVIETACSSSLVAIHRGVTALESGQCSLAIVGGVNTLVSPELHISYSKAGMLCEDGRCKPFSAQANGYVRSEGVGMLVLKKLSDAEQAGDHIYGVIRGSVENHGGRANSLTAPNPRAQADLLIAAYRKAGIDPRTVSYIEAHGTGTPLGDPIEINGLKTAWSSLAQRMGISHSLYGEGPIPEATCGIGSVKSNIGHLELAAGVAGVIKVLLQMQHKQLVKSLYCEQINPYIQLEGSPFYIVQENREWEALRDREGNALPRRAGVSSFGFGGANAHVVLEEYVPKPMVTSSGSLPQLPVLIVLSAKNEERLREQVQQLLAWLKEERPLGQAEEQYWHGKRDNRCKWNWDDEQDWREAKFLRDLAYTLQVGREPMEERLALQVSSLAELAEMLYRYLQDPQEEGHWYRGKVKRHKETMALLNTDEDLQEAIGKWLQRGKYERLLQEWVKGLKISWPLLYAVRAESAQATTPMAPTLPRRISLPTYPFARERYWVDQIAPQPGRPIEQAYGLQFHKLAIQEETTTGRSLEYPIALSTVGTSEQESYTILTQALLETLSYMASQLLKVPVEEIDAETPLSEYGFDSITFTQFIKHLNQTYQLDLTPVLFYEYSTLERFTQYLQSTYTAVLAPHFAVASPAPSRVVTGETASGSSLSRRRVPTGRLVLPLASTTPSSIAIIGMSGVFPQAPDVQSLWRNLVEGKDCIGEIPQERWDWPTSFNNSATPSSDKTNIKCAGVIEEVETFDPLFFGISKAEAEQMDPQQRLLMMYVWKAIEDAGYAASSLSGTDTALFVGTTNSGYSERFSRVRTIEGYFSTSHIASVGPNRMSYFLNLHGPSEPIETACSSSLVTIHRGVTAIESGQCTMAIVGGINTLVSPELHISLSEAGMLSKDGRCKAFSAAANGYVRSEGVGILVLKRLSDAEQAGDHIYGVIRGSAENHGGHASSLTAPNPRAQADLLIAAYRKAGIDPRTVGYIEAHGTGTELGDPIEINGLKTAFSELMQSRGEGPLPTATCGIGTVKSNIGHLELAAGVAGVIKVLLQMQHKQLVKSLHCEQINPYIQLEGSPFYIVQENRDWEALRDQEGNLLPRRAGISSFSFGGANAHVVLEEYVPKTQTAWEPRLTQAPALIVLSAKNAERLRERLQQLLAWIAVEAALRASQTCIEEEDQEQAEDQYQVRFLYDLAYTLQVGREPMEERLALHVSSLAELQEKLGRYLQGQQETGDWYWGKVRRHKDIVALLSNDEELQEAIGKWFQRGKYKKLLKGWVEGLKVEWEWLYGEYLPSRISLPTYPFAQERYWIPSGVMELAQVGLVQGSGTMQGGGVVESETSARASCAVRFMPVGTVLPSRRDLTRTVLLIPSWEEGAVEPVRREQDTVDLGGGRALGVSPLVLLYDLDDLLASHLQTRMTWGKVKQWQSRQFRREQRFQEAVWQLIQELQQLCGKPTGNSQPPALGSLEREPVPMLVQVVVKYKGEASLLQALGAVLKTVQQEYPRLWGQVIEVEGEPEEEELLAWLQESQLRMPHEQHVRYRGGKRWVRRWEECIEVSVQGRHPWKEGGCYLISGGAGGLGRLLVQEIARHVEEATVVLIGRSVLSREQQAGLSNAGKRGIHIEYEQVDVTADPAVEALIGSVLHKWGHLDGIIHSAGVLRDSLLLNKKQEEVLAVLAPKVMGVEVLDWASRDLPLDFFVLCSSLAGVVGNVGQADYAGANAYLDAFAHERAERVLAGERAGVTVSINWPLWEEGGMRVEAEVVQMMRERLGTEVIGTETGMQVLYQALSLGVAQVMVAHGEIEHIKQRLHPSVEAGLGPAIRVGPGDISASVGGHVANLSQEPSTIPGDALCKALSHHVANLLKTQIEEIDAETEFSEYGFNSISFTLFANRLNQAYQLDLSPALFYQYSTLERLTRYLQSIYTPVLAPHFAPVSPVAPSVITEDPVSLSHVPQQRARIEHVTEPLTRTRPSPIAVIGMSGCFPQAPDVQSLWLNLVEGKDCIGEIPPSRWDWQAVFGSPVTDGNKTNIKWAGIVEDVELFDPLFFGISPSEAEQMDPQQRLLMMYVWKAIEDAGYTASSLSETDTALFVGTISSGYGERVFRALPIEGYSSIGQVPSVGPNRMSYFLNLHGPSEAIETACSSSLVAIHRGVNALESGQCSIAIVGGVNTLVSPEMHVSYSKSGMLCEDGRCKTFSAAANGFVRSEGVGMLVLKRLSDAEQADDHIYGVIRGSAENHGGRASSLTAPNPRAQADLLIAAYRKAGIDPRTVGYIEAHGTGTPLGDPIEINGLKTAFSELAQILGEGPLAPATCGIGSVKSNIGHLELASGVVGVIKVLLQMQRKQLVKSLHCERLNPYIQLEGSPFYIVQENREWEALRDSAGNVLPRRAGVSSFGFGGVNAHVVLEEYIPKPQSVWKPRHTQSPALIVLSAKNEERLRELVQQQLAWMQTRAATGEALELWDLAYTLQVGREAMEERLALQVGSLAELEGKLYRYLQEPQGEGLWYRGQVKQHKEAVALLNTDEELQVTISKWFQRGEYEKLLSWWVKGLKISWLRLYTVGEGQASVLPRRISLPTYPFAKERYWCALTKSELAYSGGIGAVGAGFATAHAVHPLPHQNTSDWACANEGDVSEKHSIFGTLILQPRWREEAVFYEAVPPSYAKHVVMLCEFGELSRMSIASQMSGVDCLVLQSDQQEIDQRFQAYVIQAFEEIKKIITSKPRGMVLLQIIIPYHGEQQLFSGLAGLLVSAKREQPMLIGQLIEVEADTQKLVEILQTNSRCPGTQKIRYRDGKRWVVDWYEVEDRRTTRKRPWKDGGVYLITGGAGGLGLIFAREIAHQVKDATLILTGRSPLDAQMQESIEALRNQGTSDLQSTSGRVLYEQVDVTHKQAVFSLVQRIQQDYGRLDGIIHSAGVIRDNFLLKKTPDEVVHVLAPKVTGLVNLDQASKDLPLDCFLLFSSVAGVFGNVGQADYAAANAFMDEYARYRNRLVAAKLRQGTTLSINWPLWKDGGMHIDAETARVLAESAGMVAMETSAGMQALYRSFALAQDQVLVLEGKLSRMKEASRRMTGNAPSYLVAETPMQVDHDRLREKVIQQLKVQLSEITKLSGAQMEADEPLESYGIDSLKIVQLNQRFAGIFGELSKTLFFEYRTLEELAAYFVEDYQQACIAWTGLQEQVVSAVRQPALSVQVDCALPTQPPLSERQRPTRRITDGGKGQLEQEPIAIIGIAGRYPQARNLQDYWQCLKAGKDCITEIPLERWPLAGFYHADIEEAVKQGKSYSKWGGFVEGFADFDPLFFRMSPREAQCIDPQERLFIEVCWEALEDAGYTSEQLAVQYNRKVGVFAGITKTGFSLYGPDLWKLAEGNNLRMADPSWPSVPLRPSTSFSSVANRISYLLNLQGPSMPIDTMCSSSLTAIHEACEHIHRGECEMALAGGVNLYLHPSNYVELCAQKMLSVDGQCKSFGQGGNGFVPGEGVGVVLLKPLSRAIADHDQICAVIRATGINHGGATNGYTVPNPTAQGELIRATLSKAGIPARMVSYIEAHGTGTELGDPIEVTGLTQAFRKDTQDMGFCALGSVKSNIGHLEAAAGIAGVTKIVLQMKHQQIVPSLHAKTLNPHINFAQTPFVVQQALGDWQRPQIELDGKISEYPRIAGISSFGAGGANAHVVLEEYVPNTYQRPVITIDAHNPAIIVLSARTEVQLKQRVQQLLEEIVEQQFSDENLADIAYTLQVGREAMEERLAVMAESMPQLVDRLEQFMQGRDGIADLYRGQVKRHKEALAGLTVDEDIQKAIDTWVSKGKYHKLLDLWVKGLAFDWNKLYGESKPYRISLPTYPFAHERYWLPSPPVRTAPCACPAFAPQVVGTQAAALAILHPLVQSNTSTLWEQRFSSTFDGEEFFLTDHVIAGQRIMPAVAYLEVAYTAVREALGDQVAPESGQLHLDHVVWVRPLIVGELPVTVHITLEPQDSTTIAFLISHESEQAPEIYCQGRAILRTESAIPNVDLTSVQARCQHQLSATACYQRYRELSINYGPTLQGIEQLMVGEGEVLARLRLPAVLGLTSGVGTHTRNEEDPYMLHPSMLDSALQACIGLLVEQPALQKPYLPFELAELSIMGRVPVQGWAWVRRRSSSRPTAPVYVPPLVFDIDVCDDTGRVAVLLHGLSTRPFPGAKALDALGVVPLEAPTSGRLGNGVKFSSFLQSVREDCNVSTMLLTPDWREETDERDRDPHQYGRPSENSPLCTAQLVLLCDLPNISTSRVQAQLAEQGYCCSLTSSQPHREQRFQTAVVQLIQEIQRLLQSRPAGAVLVQVVVAHRQEPSFLEALAGVLKTAQQEYPQLHGQLIEVEGEPEEEELLAWLYENQLRIPHEPHIRYRDGKRGVKGWQEHPQIPVPICMPWKEGGCYLITGGAGGLARLFVQEIARYVQEATVILVGRSAPSVRGTSGGIHVDYQQVDVSDGPAVHALIQRILVQHGHLNGIVHAAGVLRDSLLPNKTQEQMQEVLAPKVAGVEHLDQASAEISLDFFVLCSSLAAVVGNIGQADYAAANGYLDAFAHARRAQVLAGQRRGETVAIDWPFWEEGGMRIAEETTQAMRERLGIEAMGTETGMWALYQALASGLAQVTVLHGQVERIKQRLLGRFGLLAQTDPRERTTEPEHQGEQVSVSRDEPLPFGGLSPEKLQEVLKRMVSHLLEIRVEEIDTETELSEYGFDSVTFTLFANRLNQTYQLDLTPTIFYEYSTLEHLTQYLQTTYAAVLTPYFAAASHIATAPSVALGLVPRDEAPPATPMAKRRSRLARSLMQEPESSTSANTDPIAIIGISGAFPQAPDVQSFWSNLLAGRDCISEIPASRWDGPTSFGNLAPSHPDKMNIEWAGVMEGVENFDPLFFGISPREAEQMDPQQRLLMMYAWKAIEDAGYAASSLSGTNTALFVGTVSSGYNERISHAGMTIESYSSTGQIASVGPNRMSYFLNLHGPSEPIETACSSSLIAIHRGVTAIESGQCIMAIVGGVNTLVSPEIHLSFSKAGMLSEDGRCKPFSAQANGYVRGEGVGMLVLKKLSDAERAGDHIYALIRASAENHGGRASSLTAPNPRAQADLLIAAYRKAKIDPRTVSYIEAHGTGTPLGDPIEINGLKTAFGELAQRTSARRGPYGEEEEPRSQAWCGIGSVKSNIGHLELAAGVASVIKVLLQLQHKQLVKSLHCEQINPYIQLASSPFYIVQENRKWEPLRDHDGNLLPRRAGVSSFGFGGANAHVVLEEYVPKSQITHPGDETSPNAIIVLSAKNEVRLHEQVRQLLDWVTVSTTSHVGQACIEEAMGLEQTIHGERSLLKDLAYTLQIGREEMEERLALQVSSLTELREKLHSYLQGEQGDWYRGQKKQYKELVALLSTDEEMHKTTSKWLQRSEYEKLLQWWVKGGSVDWKLLHTVGIGQEQGPRSAQGTISTGLRRISLPTYPFAPERYWISTVQGTSTPTNSFENAQKPSLVPDYRRRGIALRPLPDYPMSLHRGSRRGQALSSGNNDVVDPVEAAGFASTLEKELIRSLAQTLYMEEKTIDIEKPFVEIGLDSVVGVEWIQSLNKQYASNLRTSSVYDYPTIRQLARFLEKDLSKHQQMPLQSVLSPSLDSILQQFQQGTFDVEEADQLIDQVFIQATREV